MSPDENVNFNNQELAKIFNQACYISLKSVFQPHLKKYSSELFHEFNLLKYKNIKLKEKVDYYFCKKYNGHPTSYTFVTNGYNYYFQYCGNVSIKRYVTMILHDYFSSEYIDEINEMVSVDHMDDILTHCRCQSLDGEIIKSEEDGDYFFKDKTDNCTMVLFDFKNKSPSKVEPYPHEFCTACFDDDFNPKTDEEVLHHINDNIINSTSCIIENMFKLNNIEVVGNRIHFFTDKRVHFAACVSGYSCFEGDFIETLDECEISNIRNNVFIDFMIENNYIIFSFDFFRNNISFEYKMEKNLNFIGNYRYANRL